jgi:hypothetical protein
MCLAGSVQAGRLKMRQKGDGSMDMINFIYNEFCCFIKLTLDLTVQKIALIFNRNKSGL